MALYATKEPDCNRDAHARAGPRLPEVFGNAGIAFMCF